MDFMELKKAVEEAELVGAHAHNIVALDSALPFISAFSDANRDVRRPYPTQPIPSPSRYLRNLYIDDGVKLDKMHDVDWHKNFAPVVGSILRLSRYILNQFPSVTSFGDKDLDLRLSNPLYLRAVLEDKRFSKSHIFLLHASYPFSKEASYVAFVYSQVYLDFGLAIPKLSVHGMVPSLKELLELAPIKKVMFSMMAMHFLKLSTWLLK
ncbi:hypothetical protein M0R45_003648 [Rubus argutus]|uniref:Uncharacterized protein n=1 Tax=Rubus argutus TaxID=59490 RepID=A0AAW1YI23_RUBAR